MKSKFLSLKIVGNVGFAAVLAVATLTGCYTPDGRPDNTATGALAGGAMGAATGAAIGSASHSAGEGALIGAAAGTVLGALVGHSADEAQAARERQAYVAVPPPPAASLSTEDIKSMSRAGLKEDTIIAQIIASHAVYHLSANEIIDLHNAGVSQKVIDYMINTPTTAPVDNPVPVATTTAPPAPVAETVVVAPGPGYVWVGGEWLWGPTGWYWAPGRWVWPPYPGAIWVGGYWHYGPHGWARYGGHWRR